MRMTSQVLKYAVAQLSVMLVAHAQGTLYVSNVQQASTGRQLVAKDSWMSQVFTTGPNVGGYQLNSILLGMGASSGTPAGLEVSVFDVGSSFAPSVERGRLVGPDPNGEGVISFTTPGIPYILLCRSEGFCPTLTRRV
jgi:hypothetical protein